MSNQVSQFIDQVKASVLRAIAKRQSLNLHVDKAFVSDMIKFQITDEGLRLAATSEILSSVKEEYPTLHENMYPTYRINQAGNYTKNCAEWA